MPPEPETLRALLAEAQAALAAGPHSQRARKDAETILLQVLTGSDPTRNRAWLLAHSDFLLTPEAAAEYRALIQRRLAGEPVQYIAGEAEFYGLSFHVTRHVLIPRPETEHLVEKAIALAGGFSAPRILDIGTGSGAIAVALAVHLPHASITATDLSSSALAIAQSNARRNGVDSCIRFLAGDLLAPVSGEQFEIIVSNPPYVSAADRASLDVEVREYEPPPALFAGDDGLAIYRRLIPQAVAALVPGGFLALEIGHGQQDDIRSLLAASGFHAIEFIPDLQGIPRVAVAQRPGRALL